MAQLVFLNFMNGNGLRRLQRVVYNLDGIHIVRVMAPQRMVWLISGQHSIKDVTGWSEHFKHIYMIFKTT